MAASSYVVSSLPPPPVFAAARPRAPRSRTISCSTTPIPLALLAATAAADAALRAAPPTPVSPVCFTPSLLHAAPCVASASAATAATAAADALYFPVNVGRADHPAECIRCCGCCCYRVQFLPLVCPATTAFHAPGLLFGATTDQ
ncbi:hypothetical protein HK405_013771, partial [Cladochytrium tenue]